MDCGTNLFIANLKIFIRSVLQIRRGNKDKLGIISLFLPRKVFGDPSLELSRGVTKNVFVEK